MIFNVFSLLFLSCVLDLKSGFMDLVSPLGPSFPFPSRPRVVTGGGYGFLDGY